MANEIEPLDIVTATVRELLKVSAVTSLVGSSPEGQGPWEHYIFAWDQMVDVKGKQTSSIVVARRGSWASPNMHNTQKFPRLQIEIYSDPIRDAVGNMTVRSAMDQVIAISEAVDKVLNITPHGKARQWGVKDGDEGLRVLGCHRLQELDPTPVPKSNGEIRGLMSYGVNLG